MSENSKTPVTAKKAKKPTSKAVAKKQPSIVLESNAKPVSPEFSEPSTLIALTDITPSPFNRKYFNQAELEELAESIKSVGVIQPVTVRRVGEKFELVCGERRYRGSIIANLTHIPAFVRNLTDEEVKEIQLIENLQRSNPHPLEEADAINSMKNDKMSIDAISKRLGKSAAFVYQRMKLCNLIEPFREIFFLSKMDIATAFELARLAPDTQEAIFNEECGDWKEEEDPDFFLEVSEWTINRYKQKLANAPFDIKDENLLEGVGSCLKCPYNTATTQSLFPDDEQKAICLNKSCFGSKCDAFYTRTITDAIAGHTFEAILYTSSLRTQFIDLMQSLPELKTVPFIQRNTVAIITEPFAPQDETDNEAKEEYEQDMRDFKLELASGTYRKALFVSSDNNFHPCFITDKDNVASPSSPFPASSQPAQTAAAFNDAVKEGKVSKTVLDGEISRIKQRETRAKELDEEKIQAAVHEAFASHESVTNNQHEFTAADKIALRYIICRSIGIWNIRDRVNIDTNNHSGFYQYLEALPESEFAALVRKAIVDKGECKLVNCFEAYVMRRMAEDNGVNVDEIEKKFKNKASERGQKVEARVKELTAQLQALN